MPVTLFGERWTIFRGGRRLGAVADRCPHRGAPLSLGRTREGCLECPYHGWRFDEDGECRGIPALPHAKLGQAHQVAHRPVFEQQGWIWMSGSELRPTSPPPIVPGFGQSGFVTTETVEDLPADLVAVAENILDVPHTSFLHGGLFRREPTELRRVTVTRDSQQVQADFHDEPIPGGVLGRLLAPRSGGFLEHRDRFLRPCLAVVEYALGDRRLVIANALTPLDSVNTRVWARASLRAGAGSALLSWITKPVGRRVLSQDRRILEAIREGEGPSGVSTEADLLRPHIRRLLRDAQDDRGTPSWSRTFELRL